MPAKDYHSTAIPTPRQLQYQDWEFGIFLHFGIRTFFEGHRDWDGKPMPLDGFNPSAFDADQWARTAAEAGAAYMVFVAKHHDGFANWPSAYSSYSVSQTPWRDGKGDVVRDFVDACRAHRLAVGIYYSPAEWGNPIFEHPHQYDDHFINQISELLQNYGDIDILWFDGCGSEGHVYDWNRIIATIRRLQPNILIFNMGDPDFRWVGNEAGIAPQPCWNTVVAVPFSVQTDNLETVDVEPRWLPAECDCRMRLQNWFFEEADTHTVKSVDELMGLYYLSVGRGCNLLLNIGPDRHGLLPEPDATRLLEFGAEIRRRFSHPVATLDDFERTDTTWSFAASQRLLVDHLVIEEELTAGEHIRQFTIECEAGGRILLAQGANVGHKAIVRFPAVPLGTLRLRIDKADGPVNLRALSLYSTLQS